MNLAQIIEPHPAGATALCFRGAQVTYGELRSRCASARRSLAARQVAAGDRVAIIAGGTPEFVVAYLGVLGAGAVAVPLNPNSPLAELASELGAVRPSLVVTAGAAADVHSGATAEAELARLGHAVASVGDLEGAGAATETAGEPLVAERQADDPAVLLFTSGTAGAPKAAILTHGNLLSNIEQVELRVGLAATPEDVGLLAVPPFHVLGLNAVIGVQLYAGSCVVLLERFDARTALEAIATERVTLLAGVPQMFSAFCELDPVAGGELATVRLACSGAAPLPLATARGVEERFGVKVWQGYGLTEASPTVTFPDLRGAYDPASVGVPLPGVEVRVVDADGEDVEPGDPGEILVRGPNVFAGYFEDAAASSAAVDRLGWLHTGDVAVMDEEGALTIVDRKKDLVIVSGFNVYPAEVEQVIAGCPGVAEVAVVGVPDDEHGERVRAFVVPTAEAWPAGVPAPTGVTADAVHERCVRSLARYKCPAEVTFVRDLPRGRQGKVLRRAVG